jgi:anion-transporting  ArsA/GET3 family ATPase
MTRANPRVGPMTASHVSAPSLDVDALLDDPGRRIIVCCGSGGVGKTTTAAALALRAAERGRKVVVLTIDPARRLAQSMGIEALDNLPRPVPGVGGAPVPEPVDGSTGSVSTGSVSTGSVSTGSTTGTGAGSLDAMMLDMKRTFDEVVESQASPEKAQQILNNPFYIAVSSSFAGTQEYMAMEKLGQLDKDARASGRWDLIVVDTPPSRSALDFLDAPERLSSFLDGRFMKLLLAPARGPARLMTAGFNIVTKAVTTIIGGQVLSDMQAFVSAFDTLFGGFRQRAQRTFELLQATGTSFVVVAAPEPDALREAAYFVERLSEERMPLAGLVVNRASVQPQIDLSAAAAMSGYEKLRDSSDDASRMAAGLLRLHADRRLIVEREARLRSRFATAHPHVATAVLPALPTDVHDLDGLRRIGELLGA